MDSIMKNRYIDVDKVDNQILSLFPSLDLCLNVHKQTKKRMRTHLQILKIAAETGYVTNYMLTNEKASPRFGGQVAHDSFKHLEKIGLLQSRETLSVKKRPRRDLILTPKGIIACMALPEFQQTSKLRLILERPYYKENVLASTLRIYNNEGVRRQYDVKSPISPAIIIVKELASDSYGFNLERKSEDDISSDLRNIEEKGFLDSLKTSPFEFQRVLIEIAQDDEMRNQLHNFMDEISKVKSDPELLHQVNIETGKMVQSMISFFTSPAFRIWAKTKKKKSQTLDFRELREALGKRLEKIDFKNLSISEMFEHYFKAWKEKILSDLLNIE